MTLVSSIRARQTNLINQNPASITITRSAKTRKTSGGWDPTPTVLAAQTVRIYDKTDREILVNEAGFSTTRSTKMIALFDANILPKAADNQDKFTYDGKTYEIFDVKNEYVENSIVFKTCRLQKL